MEKKTKITFVTILFGFLFISSICYQAYAWSNGGKSTSESNPDYGTHDQIAKYGMLYVKENYPELTAWIEEDISEFFYWTEVPDMVYQDWTNHNYDFGDYGYCGGPPDRGAPDAVQWTYDWVVGNLTLWVNEGQPSDSVYTSDARKSLGLLAHYLGDLGNPMHTDDDATENGKEHEDYSGRIGDYMYRMSYHSCHEKATDRALDAYEIEFDSIRPDITLSLHNDTAHDEALWVAQYSNMGPDREGRTTGYEGQDVGDYYQAFLEEIVYGFDNKIVTVHHGVEIEGTTDQLYYWNVDQLKLASTSLGKIIYHAGLNSGIGSGGGSDDTTPPTVTITDPADGATVSGIVTISADASDDVGVSKVEFYVDNTLIGTDTSEPYSISWDSTTVENGSYIIKAIAYDTSGNTNSDQISITVENSEGELSNTMHVQSIDWEYTYKRGRYPNRILEAFILVVDGDGNVVANAEVTITWTFPDGTSTTMTALTDSNGIAYFKQEYCETGTHTVTVEDIVKTDWIYDSSQNIETSSSYTI